MFSNEMIAQHFSITIYNRVCEPCTRGRWVLNVMQETQLKNMCYCFNLLLCQQCRFALFVEEWYLRGRCQGRSCDSYDWSWIPVHSRLGDYCPMLLTARSTRKRWWIYLYSNREIHGKGHFPVTRRAPFSTPGSRALLGYSPVLFYSNREFPDIGISPINLPKAI